jgi:hypothetical protein
MNYLPRRYFVDGRDRRVLIGLTFEETSEFEKLDNPTALNQRGELMACDDSVEPETTREKRWRELYAKHDVAWRTWQGASARGR